MKDFSSLPPILKYDHINEKPRIIYRGLIKQAWLKLRKSSAYKKWVGAIMPLVEDINLKCLLSTKDTRYLLKKSSTIEKRIEIDSPSIECL